MGDVPKGLVGLTVYQEWKQRWQGCTGCPLHECRKNIVLCRGKIPCEILLIGESPGQSEDLIGRPFTGPAGHQLDRMIDASGLGEVRLAFTNLVCCIPLGEDGKKTKDPDKDDIVACQTRLREFVEVADPDVIVCVGTLARDWTDPQRKKRAVTFHRDIPRVDIIHPAAILRANIANRGLMIRRCVVALHNVLVELPEYKAKRAKECAR